MLALKLRPPPRACLGTNPEVLAEALRDGVNLAIWQRVLTPEVQGFVAVLLARGVAITESLILEPDSEGRCQLEQILAPHAGWPGYAAFMEDLRWLSEAFVCLLGAQRVGLRLRSLDKPMCPRFHVDHVPLRLITTFAGVASEWLEEGGMDRRRLGEAAAEPRDGECIQRLETGWVALAKGEKWPGNEGAGLIHRSPTLPPGERRMLLTLDWLA